MSKPTLNTRLIAARVINEVAEGHSLSDSLNHALDNVPDARDRGFIRAICFGVCRYYTRLDVLLSFLLKKPMKAKDSDVHALILVGLYQLIDMRVPEHAAVAETVNAAEKLNKQWAARGFVNAILREYLRQREVLEKKLQADPEAKYAHPQWWIDDLKAAWPNDWENILAANNEHPPMSLRVNRQLISRDNYLKKLADQQIAAHAITDVADGIILSEPQAVEALPGFGAGEITVQDGAPQLAATFLDLKPNQHVLDACAAPGGKLTHLLECEPSLTVVAIEKEAKRIPSIEENLKRLNMQDRVKCFCVDAADTSRWWDKQLFDRILLDAPCSASGIIRRHPDIKLLKQPDDIAAFTEEQAHLLETLWPLLKKDGLFLYATCSIFPDENTHLIESFLKTHNDAKEIKLNSAYGIACKAGLQILPGKNELDGFYYALLKKI